MGSIISDEKVEAPKTFKCPHCVKRYTSKQGMMLHIESYHKKQGKTHSKTINPIRGPYKKHKEYSKKQQKLMAKKEIEKCSNN